MNNQVATFPRQLCITDLVYYKFHFDTNLRALKTTKEGEGLDCTNVRTKLHSSCRVADMGMPGHALPCLLRECCLSPVSFCSSKKIK